MREIISINCIFEDKYAVCCRTKDEAAEVIALLMECGARFRRKRTAYEFANLTFKQCIETCYTVRDGFIAFSGKDWWMGNGYTVIESEDLARGDEDDMGNEVLLEYLTSLTDAQE